MMGEVFYKVPYMTNKALSFQCNGIGYQVNLPADSIATIVMEKNE